MNPAIISALTRAEQHSPFLRQLIDRHPDLVSIFQSGDFEAAQRFALALTADSIVTTLRQRRNGLALVTAIADLSGAWDLARVTATLSDFADAALDDAIAAAIQEHVPDAPNIGFTVIALGKHGGRELNYSSDIDPIFLYDPLTIPKRANEDPAQSAVRIGKRVIEILSKRDAHGYVFRVDMRLRPASEISPIALSINAAISHYESSALAWEQAAFIRSRVAAGDKDLGARFLRSIQSFIWRRSIDFGQLQNIRNLSAQIRDHYHRGQILGPGFDLKRGRGGIRECEFFAQAHQLIHGGRNPELRIADTRAALAALSYAQIIPSDDAAVISESYALLRSIEHRLQMIDDRQTHMIPTDLDAIDQVARLHGLENGNALIALLNPSIQKVRARYDDLVGDENEANLRLAQDGLPLEEQLRDMGFADPADPLRRIARWRSGKLRAVRSPAAHSAFEAILPALLRALSQSPDPQYAIARFDNLIEALPSAINFFHLLAARPALLKLVADILSYAPILAETLGRKPELLDGLIDMRAFASIGDTEALLADMEHQTDKADYQTILDIIRNFVGELRFKLGVQLIETRQDPIMIAQSYAHIAHAALSILTQATVREFEHVHGKIPDGELIILALGRFGGGVLTHASDLDLIFLFTGDFAAQSDGAKPLGGTHYFNRLAQRVIAALSAPTASGALYEIDTRLRPSGMKGLLCSTVDSFATYQQEQAWTWEHMALIRARPIYGSSNACDAVQSAIDTILATSRDKAKLLGDIVQMRDDMAQHKPPKGPMDIKAVRGGLVDIEFIVHALQLQGAAKPVPPMHEAIALLIEQHALPPAFAQAHDLLTRLLISLRLVSPDNQIPPAPVQSLIVDCLKFEDWPALMLAIEQAKATVIKVWNTLFETHLGKNS